MLKYIFIFSSTVSELTFETTYEALCAYLDANNQYEDVFYAKDPSGKVVNLLEAETYVKEIHPVKDYLEIASLACFDDNQILEETEQLFGIHNTTVPESWRQHMKEYLNGYNIYLKEKEKAAETYSHVARIIDEHNSSFDEARDDAYLRQFGIRRLTGLRNSIEKHEETAIDRAINSRGLAGACNDSALQDFVIEKDGVQMLVFVEYGTWAIGSLYVIVPKN